MIDNKEMSKLYEELIKAFFVFNNIKEVVCTDTKEHFFDKVLIDKDGNLAVYNHGLKEFTWKRFYFDFTLDYATCLANMEHDLFLQVRNGKHKNYTFKFNEKQ